MNALQSGLPQHLRTFVEPQVEQLSFAMEPIQCGLYGKLPESLGEGFLWTAPLGEDCLVSKHSLRLKHPLSLEERPTDFSCIFSGSRATFLSLPGANDRTSAEMENLAAFSQVGGTTCCLMEAGVLYESTSITYTPDYFDKVAKDFPNDFGTVGNILKSFNPSEPPVEMKSILRSFSPQRAILPGATPFFHAKALEALATLLAQSSSVIETRGRKEDCELVERVEEIILTRFAEPLTVGSIASELYVSRSKLSEAFRHICGMGVAERLRKQRMNAACRLMDGGRTSVSDIARAVGYARTSSFDEAFRREIGCSPTAWKDRDRAQ